MKSYIYLITYLLSSVAMAQISLSDYTHFNEEEKLSAIDGDFLTGIKNIDEVLKIYNLGLIDESAKVRRRVAIASFYLTQALQEIKSSNEQPDYLEDDFKYPSFSREDSDLFQVNLLKALNSNDVASRHGAAAALIYSYPPSEDLEKFFIAHLTRKSNADIKAELIKVMTLAGYHSDEFVSILVSLLHPDNKEGLEHIASVALASIKPTSALLILTKWAPNPEAPQMHLLWTLGALSLIHI